MSSEARNYKQRKVSWEALTYFNFYRFLVAFLFVSLYWIGQLPEPLGKYDRTLFAISAHIYLLVSVIAQLFVRFKFPTFVLQVFTNVLIDVLIITLMMYASAGLNSGFGMLVVIAVAAGSLLSSGRMSILYASVASLAILGNEVYMQLTHEFPRHNYAHAGFLGGTFFLVALISNRLANRVEESVALAEQRGQDLENLSKLNEYIVQRLQSGIIVLDDESNVRLLNESAKRLMGISMNQELNALSDFSSELDSHVKSWQENETQQNKIIKVSPVGHELQVSCSQLDKGEQFETLIFLEEASVLRQRAQQMKLASLARLTASIAHEIRNPLGAISHAGQLLSESTSLQGDEKRLTSIIEEHSKRVNNIVENVLSISRREQTVSSEIKLGQWLKKFAEEFIVQHELSSTEFKLIIEQKDISARMDPGQLEQVLWNLCENGMRYSKSNPVLKMSCSVFEESGRPYIDIVDSGSGISKDIEEQLFEPFFTTNTKGTGLGLFIARELCEANQATLNLHTNSENGCSFRISFSHIKKQHSFIQ